MPTDLSFIKDERKEYINSLIRLKVLEVNNNNIPTFADTHQEQSRILAQGVANRLISDGYAITTLNTRSTNIGTHFEEATCVFLNSTLKKLNSLSSAKMVAMTKKISLGEFEQLKHIPEIKKIVSRSDNPSLRALLGDYFVKPDIIVYKEPLDINTLSFGDNDDDIMAKIREYLKGKKNSLHANISLKWTIRSDRSQNTRTECQNFIRNRNGRVPHLIGITAEPMPSRIASIAQGTEDLDCVYHPFLYELLDSANLHKSDGKIFEKAYVSLNEMVQTNRLKDVSLLPIDLLD